jgi:hypothetical protein
VVLQKTHASRAASSLRRSSVYSFIHFHFLLISAALGIADTQGVELSYWRLFPRSKETSSRRYVQSRERYPLRLRSRRPMLDRRSRSTQWQRDGLGKIYGDFQHRSTECAERMDSGFSQERKVRAGEMGRNPSVRWSISRYTVGTMYRVLNFLEEMTTGNPVYL